MATHILDIHIYKLTEFSLTFVSFFHIFQLIDKTTLNKPITKQLHIDPVVLVNACIVAFICLSIQVIKYTIKSLYTFTKMTVGRKSN